MVGMWVSHAHHQTIVSLHSYVTVRVASVFRALHMRISQLNKLLLK